MAAVEKRDAETLSPEEGRKLFDELAREYLHMSREEFLERWDSGKFADPDHNPDVMLLAMLLPLAR
jgi:hypothetical protein